MRDAGLIGEGFVGFEVGYVLGVFLGEVVDHLDELADDVFEVVEGEVGEPPDENIIIIRSLIDHLEHLEQQLVVGEDVPPERQDHEVLHGVCLSHEGPDVRQQIDLIEAAFLYNKKRT